MQPSLRKDYNDYMVGADVADQLNNYYITLHKAKNYFWRRVFEQKLMQACSNAWLVFRWWLSDMMAKVDAKIKLMESARESPGQGTAEGVLLAALKKEREDLEVLGRKSRAQWMRALATHLMSRCTEGCATRGGRRKRKGTIPAFQQKKDRLDHLRPISRSQHCYAPSCKGSLNPRVEKSRRHRPAKISKACFCDSCRRVGGVPICPSCHVDDDKHAQAYERMAKIQQDHANKRRSKVPKFEEK